MHHMRAGGAMDHNFDALQGAHPVGLRSDVANHARWRRRSRRQCANDTDNVMTTPREILHSSLPDESTSACDDDHRHESGLESKSIEIGKLNSTRSILSSIASNI
jgi:hypothetical protein